MSLAIVEFNKCRMNKGRKEWHKEVKTETDDGRNACIIFFQNWFEIPIVGQNASGKNI